MKHNKIAFEKQQSSNKHDPKPKGVHENNRKYRKRQIPNLIDM
ncbi:15092_t:CDS:2, partial [Funneliformis caledonium]